MGEGLARTSSRQKFGSRGAAWPGREVRNEKKVPKVFSASNRVLRSSSALLMILSFDIVFASGHIYDGTRRE